jgi:hypothetical protein
MAKAFQRKHTHMHSIAVRTCGLVGGETLLSGLQRQLLQPCCQLINRRQACRAGAGWWGAGRPATPTSTAPS